MVNLRSLAYTTFLSLATSFALHAGTRPTLDLTVEDALRLPKGRLSIYSPLKLKTGDSVSFTTLQIADLPAREIKVDRGLQINIFAVDPNNPDSYGLFVKKILATSAPSAAGGGGGGAQPSFGAGGGMGGGNGAEEGRGGSASKYSSGAGCSS